MMKAVYETIRTTAEEIDRAWMEHDRSLTHFTDLAWDATAKIDLSPVADLSNLIDLLAVPEVAGVQRLSTFSDLYLMLHDGQVQVEVLNWWDSDINIHDHDFAGVQMQLSGRSLNVTYSMQSHDELDGILVGDMSIEDAEIWRPGNRSRVHPGRVAPHNVNHLTVPTVSLLFRTRPHVGFGPQYNYFPPGVAASYDVADRPFRVQLDALRLLAAHRPATFRSLARQALERQSPRQNLFMFVKLVDVVFTAPHVELIRQFANQGPLHHRLVRSLVTYRVTDYLTNVLKRLPGLEPPEVLALSVLGSSWDRPSCEKILTLLHDKSVRVRLADALTGVERCGSPRHRQMLLNILEGWGLADLVRRTSKAIPPSLVTA